MFRKKFQEKSVVEPKQIQIPSASPADLRIAKDFADLDLPENVTLVRDKTNMKLFSFVINPQDGYWAGGQFEFKFNVPNSYPYDGPKVTCVDKIWHPNIDLDGGVCVSVLRPWRPITNIQGILFGLLLLFSNPNPNDSLNEDAAKQMRDNIVSFKNNVILSLKGKLTVTDSISGKSTSFSPNHGLGPFKVESI